MADRSQAPGRRSPSIALLILVFAATLPAVTTRFYASDEVQYYVWLRSPAFDGDVDFENEYRYFHDAGTMRDPGFRTTFLEETNEAGRRRNFTPIGTAILWAPFFAVGHAAARILGAQADGFSAPYIAAVTIGSAAYGFAALLLTHAFLRRLTGGGWVSTLAIWAGTPLVFYMYVAPGFSHACSAFAVSLFLYAWIRVRDRWTAAGTAALGATAALMAMVREQDAFLVVGPAIDFLRWSIGRSRQTTATPSTPRPWAVARVALAGAAAGVALYAPQLLAYYALNGHPGPTREVARKMTWSSPHLLEVLWSPAHGLFFWTPLALAAVAGLVWLAATGGRARSPALRWIGTLALVMVTVEVYVSGSVESWTVAGSFGQRRFVGLTPLFALGLDTWTSAVRAGRRSASMVAWGTLVVLCAWWNVGLMAQFGLHLMDRQRLTLRENARRTFVDLPATMPSLVARYFMDRDSFYRLPRQ
jgi:hypothetical protein